MEKNAQSQVQQQEVEDIGPPHISFSTLLLKILGGGVGGSLGGLILLLAVLLLASFFPDDPSIVTISPIFVFLIMVVIFIASTASNILSVLLISLTEREKYTRVKSAIYQVFIVNVIIFLLMVPVYFITSLTSVAIVPYAVALHIIVSAQMSATILEIVSNYKYALVGIYGITFSVLLSAAGMFAIYAMTGQNSTILLFLAIPIVWTSIAIVQTITTVIYGSIARTYDKDFLSTQEVYGDDYGKEVVDEEDLTPKADDEEGADFLRHN